MPITQDELTKNSVAAFPFATDEIDPRLSSPA